MSGEMDIAENKPVGISFSPHEDSWIVGFKVEATDIEALELMSIKVVGQQFLYVFPIAAKSLNASDLCVMLPIVNIGSHMSLTFRSATRQKIAVGVCFSPVKS